MNILLSLFLMILSTQVFADEVQPVLKGRHGGGAKVKHEGAHEIGKGIIRGVCEILASPSNPVAGTCVTFVLILKDEKGAEVMKARTDTKGQFDFTIEGNKKYQIVSGSKYYQVVNPKQFITAEMTQGKIIALQLQQN